MGWTSLPNELLECIFDGLDGADLLALRQCDRAWRDLVDPKVFAALSFDTRIQDHNGLRRRHDCLETQAQLVTSFRSTWIDPRTGIALPSLRRLGVHVRHIEIRTKYLHVDDITALLAHCPNVKRLDVDAGFLKVENRRLLQGYGVDDCLTTNDLDDDGADFAVSSYTGLGRNWPQMSDDLPAKLRPILVHMEEMTIYGDLPARVFCDALVPNLCALQRLTLERETWGWHWPGIPAAFWPGPQGLAAPGTSCPNLTFLSFGMNLGTPFDHAFLKGRHEPGNHVGCDACMNPWPSVDTLHLITNYNANSLNNLPSLLAFICLKFPNIKMLTLKPPINAAGTEARWLSNPSWKHLLNLQRVQYLPSLISLTIPKILSRIVPDVLYFYTTAAGQWHAPIEMLTMDNDTPDSAPFDVIRALCLFPRLHDLCMDVHWVIQQEPPTRPEHSTLGHALPVPEQHPLRKIVTNQPVSDHDRAFLCQLCPDLVIKSKH
ncbi:hypothetical protein BC940DRAFT_314521 [Gongronella butleri]|nr:hypothetical protein BC940DRAFT_314521 [Gongronella butleri]